MTRRTRPARSHTAPTLALCVIARDEERFIADCLDSARDFVDEVVVVDTGSTDRTREIAREHGARVEEFAWCDNFAAARNAAIEAATADWILMLDADERLDPSSGPVLRDVVRGAPRHVHALSPVIENRDLAGTGPGRATVAVPRLFPRRRDLRFVGAIHEVITYLPEPSRTVSLPVPTIKLVHYGYDNAVYAERDKDSRNLALLERELERGNDDPRLPFFLLQQHVIAQRNAEAVASFEPFARVADRLPRPFLVQAYSLLLTALIRLDDRSGIERAIAEADRAGALGAPVLDLLTDYYTLTDRPERAIVYLRRLLEPNLPAGLERAEGRQGWPTRLALADLLGRTNQPRQALEQLERAFPELPAERRGDVAVQAATYALGNADLLAAQAWAQRAIAHAPETFQAQHNLLRVLLTLHAQAPGLVLQYPWSAIDAALAAEDLQRSYDLACELPPESMAGVVRLHVVAAQVRAAGEPRAALGLLNRALDGPRAAPVYWLLIQTLSQLARYQDAQLALTALRSFEHSQHAA